MGADLYIPKIQNPLRKEHEPLFNEAVRKRDLMISHGEPRRGFTQADVDAAQALVNKHHNAMYSAGYFRDSYNSSSLLWVLDLSWWKDVTSLFDIDAEDSEINCSPDACQKIKDLILSHPLPSRSSFVRPNDFDTACTDDDIYSYFKKKYDSLLTFLDEAIANGGMYASV